MRLKTVTVTLILVLVVFTLAIWLTLTKILHTVTVTGGPNRNVNWSRGSSSSQWFWTSVQSNFTHYRLNCFVDLLCICFRLFYIIIAANALSLFFFFLNGYVSPKFHWPWSSANFIHVLWHLWNVKRYSQLLHNKVIIQRRISNNTKASFTKIWPHNDAYLCDSMIKVCC